MQIKILNYFDTLLDSVFVVNDQLQIQYANEAFSNLIGIPLKRIKAGKPANEFIDPYPEFWKKIQDSLASNEATPYFDITYTPANKDSVSLQITMQPLLLDTDNGKIKCALIFARDITLEKNLQQKYRRELGEKEDYINQLNRRLFELSFLLQISSIITHIPEEDEPSVVEMCLQKTMDTFPFKSGMFLTLHDGKDGLDFKVESQINGVLLPDTSNSLKRNFDDIENTNEPIIHFAGEHQFVILKLKSKGSLAGLLLFEVDRAKPPIQQSDLKILDAMSTQLAVTFENEVLYLKSITDEKTKLYNSRYFNTVLKEEVTRTLSGDSPFALLVIDIDHFKKFNDTYGHQVGDIVLKQVALQIKSSIRASDIAARFGGEEFVVLLINNSPDRIMIAAERIRTNIESMGVPTDEFGSLKVTVSIGAASCPEHAKTEQELIENADKALYHAKRSGRNNSQIYDSKTMLTIAK